MPKAVARATGTRPDGARSETDASRKVREMFTEIAPRYDLLNHLLSFQFDQLWRRRAVRRLRSVFCGQPVKSQALVLDLCCGTADLGIALNRGYTTARVVGIDFAHSMLVRGQKKNLRQHSPDLVQLRPMRFVEGDALCLPFADNSFHLVATAFGFRNLANYEAGLKEIQRVLRPGGTIAILEFCEPPAGLLGDLYSWYFRRVLPWIGGLISGKRDAYTYLPASVSRFFRPSELSALMSELAYESVGHEVWTLGTVAFHRGVKSEGL